MIILKWKVQLWGVTVGVRKGTSGKIRVPQRAGCERLGQRYWTDHDVRPKQKETQLWRKDGVRTQQAELHWRKLVVLTQNVWAHTCGAQFHASWQIEQRLYLQIIDQYTEVTKNKHQSGKFHRTYTHTHTSAISAQHQHISAAQTSRCISSVKNETDRRYERPDNWREFCCVLATWD